MFPMHIGHFRLGARADLFPRCTRRTVEGVLILNHAIAGERSLHRLAVDVRLFMTAHLLCGVHRSTDQSRKVIERSVLTVTTCPMMQLPAGSVGAIHPGPAGVSSRHTPPD